MNNWTDVFTGTVFVLGVGVLIIKFIQWILGSTKEYNSTRSKKARVIREIINEKKASRQRELMLGAIEKNLFKHRDYIFVLVNLNKRPYLYKVHEILLGELRKTRLLTQEECEKIFSAYHARLNRDDEEHLINFLQDRRIFKGIVQELQTPHK